MSDIRFKLSKAAQGLTLKRSTEARPAPGPGEVLVRVHAVSINRRDVMIMQGFYPVGDADEFTPLSDAAGEIVAIGAGVATVAVGDRVCSTFNQNWPEGRITAAALFSSLGGGGPGVLGEYIVLSANGITPVPADWSYEEAATLPCAGVTAWSGLINHGRLQKDDWVLLLGTGGVALFGLQIAAAAGAKTILLSSSDEKLERVRALGVTATINYTKQPEWSAAVMAATGGVHHVLEVGGTGTFKKSIASLALGGHIAMIGALAGFGGEISALDLIMKVGKISCITTGSRADQLALSAFAVEHRIRPVIDSVFNLDSVDKAYARANEGAFGKVVVKLVT